MKERCEQCGEPVGRGLFVYGEYDRNPLVFCGTDCRDAYVKAHTRDLEGMAEE